MAPESIHTLPMEGGWGGGGAGVLKAKLLQEKYEAKLEFSGGGAVMRGCKTKNLP